MPYPQFHSCRLKSPDDFQPKSFRTLTDNQPKGMTRIIARPKGKTTTETQAIRYDKDSWTEDRARANCEKNEGTFEPAEEGAEEAVVYPEASWQDILGLALDEAIEKYEKERDMEEAVTIDEAIHAHGEHVCVCPECGKEITVAESEKCNTKECPDCGTRMRAEDIGERRESMDFSYNDKQTILRAAIYAKFGKGSDRYYLWVQDVWDKYVVYEDSETGKYYQVSYIMDDHGDITLGDAKEVVRRTVYEPVTEAATIKAQIQNFLRQADALLKTKDLPDSVVANVKAMRTALHKTWEELGKEGEPEGEPAAEALHEATKTEDGKAFPASDYAYVPDPDKPSTWKLRLTATPGGTPDSSIVGAAIAALGKGFRGQKVEIPSEDLPAVKAKVRAAWKKANPDRDPDEIPPVIKEVDLEDIEIDGDFMALVEAVAKEADTVRVKIIQPGWGASGYYSPEVLKNAAPIYKEGTKMFWDHPTMSEERERPERSLKDLAGILVSDGEWDEKGLAGAGIYASAKVFGGYRDVLAEIAPHIGVSHRAFGKAKKGEAEGQKGNIIEQITAAQSVDFVTSPAAGGKVLQLFEAAKGIKPIEIESEGKEEDEVTAEEAKELKERMQKVEEENARLKEVQLLNEANAFVIRELGGTQLPDLTKQRLTEALGKNPPVKEDKLDEESFKARIKEAVDSEMEYLSKVAPSGVIRGMGSGSHDDKPANLKETFKAAFMREGKSEDEADTLAEIAAMGR